MVKHDTDRKNRFYTYSRPFLPLGKRVSTQAPVKLKMPNRGPLILSIDEAEYL